jgi:hypothetical protein
MHGIAVLLTATAIRLAIATAITVSAWRFRSNMSKKLLPLKEKNETA